MSQKHPVPVYKLKAGRAKGPPIALDLPLGPNETQLWVRRLLGIPGTEQACWLVRGDRAFRKPPLPAHFQP